MHPEPGRTAAHKTPFLRQTSSSLSRQQSTFTTKNKNRVNIILVKYPNISRKYKNQNIHSDSLQSGQTAEYFQHCMFFSSPIHAVRGVINRPQKSAVSECFRAQSHLHLTGLQTVSLDQLESFTKQLSSSRFSFLNCMQNLGPGNCFHKVLCKLPQYGHCWGNTLSMGSPSSFKIMVGPAGTIRMHISKSSRPEL